MMLYVLLFIILILILAAFAFQFWNGCNTQCQQPGVLISTNADPCGSNWGVGLVVLIFFIILIGVFCWRNAYSGCGSPIADLG